MKYEIIQAPSPNFNERVHPLDMLVLHYTGMKDGPTALARMQDDQEPRVSAHYMVEEDGRIFQLVAEDKRAWQAGRSWWQGDEDLNSRSIGIEIVNGGHDFGLPPFPDVQIAAVIALCQDILARWPIAPHRVVAHSDIAPDRKEDPGERFPWKQLAEAGIGLWPQPVRPEPWMMHGAAAGDAGMTVEGLQNDLKDIGYKLNVTGVFNDDTAAVIRAFQRRWRPERVNGEGDTDTITLAHAVADLVRAAKG
ncbi:MAG: N-acetylmuramoyl-L-alanine amidase [Burkholderiales bacterium]|nr:MAG: N-acetylmuramoyl-L-alanine amidase [Burkholderiales bacterium]